VHHASNEFRRTAVEFLSGRSPTYATVLVGICLKAYGAEALEWDPLTLESQIQQDFGVEMPDEVYEQLFCLINVISTDTVYHSVAVFDATVSHLCRSQHHDTDAPSPYELAWACFEIMINDPDPYDQKADHPPFSHDIARYCGVVLADAGFKTKPMTLGFASMPQWAAKDQLDDPEMENAAIDSETATSADVDREVEKNAAQLIQDLKTLKIAPAPLLQEETDDLPQADPLAGIVP
jgi:hypothetical protein